MLIFVSIIIKGGEMPDIQIKMPEIEIKDIILTEVAEKLKGAKGLVEAVVRSALTQKERSYDSSTIFEREVKDMIRDVATETFKKWIDENKEIIRKAIETRLGIEKKTFIEKVADQIVNGLAKSFYVSVNLKVEEEQ